MKDSMESSDAFADLLTEWQRVEDRSIANAQEIIKKAASPVVRIVMEHIKHDSERHKIMLYTIRESVKRGESSVDSGEISSLADLLRTHLAIKEKAVALGDALCRGSELPATRLLLSVVLDNETAHCGIIKRLEDLQKAVLPEGTTGSNGAERAAETLHPPIVQGFGTA